MLKKYMNVKNIALVILALTTIALAVLLVIRPSVKVKPEQEKLAQTEINSLIDNLEKSYVQMDLPGFYQHFSKDQSAVHVFGMRAYPSVDSLMGRLKMDYSRIVGMRMSTAGRQITLIDRTHALVTAQGAMRFTEIGGKQSETHIYNWAFLLERQQNNWVIIRSQQSFSR